MSSGDILEQLAQDARRLRVARKLPDEQLNWDWIRRVRDDFRQFQEDSGLSLAEISKKLGTGFSQTALSKFSNIWGIDDYIGDIQKITRGINQFIETWARKQEVPRPAGWVETKVARRMLTLINETVSLSTIGLIYADAGRGKTMTLQAAAGIYPGSILIRVRTTTRTLSGLAAQIAQALRLRSVRTARQAQDKLIDTLKGSDRPLLIDEAHQLNQDALEFLRDMHDECGLPIVLAGTYKINEACDDKDIFFGQFNRRIGLRYDVCEDALPNTKNPQPLHSVEEIMKLFHSDKLKLTDDGAVMLTKLSNVLGLGGLGLANQVVLVASRMKAKSALDAKLAMRIIRRIHGKTYAVRRIEKAVEDLRLKVA